MNLELNGLGIDMFYVYQNTLCVFKTEASHISQVLLILMIHVLIIAFNQRKYDHHFNVIVYS